MPMDSISMCSNTLCMSKIHAGSSGKEAGSLNHDVMPSFWLHKWPIAPKSEPQSVWVYLFKASTVCPWTAYQCDQTLCIHLIWMWKVVWGGCQPQPWHNDIILTLQGGLRWMWEAVVVVAVSLNHDVMTSFWFLKWPSTPKSEPIKVGITVLGCWCMCSWTAYQCAQTLCIWFKMDAGSSLRWLAASTMT